MCFFVGEVILPLTSGRTDRAEILECELILKRSRKKKKNIKIMGSRSQRVLYKKKGNYHVNES